VRFWRGVVLAGIMEDETVNEPTRGFFGGYHLELIALDLPTLPAVGLPYGWGRDFTSFIDDYRNMAGMFINGEDLSQATNRITLDDKVKDANGLPVAHVHVDEHANDKAMRQHARTQGTKCTRPSARSASSESYDSRYPQHVHGADEREPERRCRERSRPDRMTFRISLSRMAAPSPRRAPRIQP